MSIVNNVRFAWPGLAEASRSIRPVRGLLMLAGLSVLSYLADHYMNRSTTPRPIVGRVNRSSTLHPIIDRVQKDALKGSQLDNRKHLEVGELHYSPEDEEELACQAPNIKNFGFKDYLEPNEGTPSPVQPHLGLMEEGWIVSTGTERSIFDLLLSDPSKCKGVIVRDLNPKVKAYLDFLILLLRSASSREEFVAWTKLSLEELKEILLPKILENPMSDKMKAYYTENFTDLGSCYLGVKAHLPSVGDNTGINYFEDDALFNKLQKYAKAGKIIATVGGIGDLEFAGKRKVTLVDASNIHNYCNMKFDWNGDHVIRLIHTMCAPRTGKTSYYSGVYTKPSRSLQEKMSKLLGVISNDPGKAKDIIVRKLESTEEPSIFETLPDNCYTESNCAALQKGLMDKEVRQSYGIKAIIE